MFRKGKETAEQLLLSAKLLYEQNDTGGPVYISILQNLARLYIELEDDESVDIYLQTLGKYLGEHDLQDEKPAAFKLIRPVYPENAQLKLSRGWVQVQFNVDEKGRVQNPEVVDTNVPPRDVQAFSNASLEAVLKSRYVPSFVDGHFVEVKDIHHVYRFGLQR